MIKTVYRLEEVIDFAWELSQDNLLASYHRIKSKKDIKQAIERAISSDNENIIACYHEEVLCGICIYFWKYDEKYAQTVQFLIKEDYEQTADELIGHISNQLAGYELFIGVPFTNKNAAQYFMKKNIKCIESSIDTRLYNLRSHINQKYEVIEKVTELNFEEYAMFHDKYAIPLEMYYNSKNLLKDVDRFRIFVFRQDDVIHASIFVKADKKASEVFGLFIDEKYKNAGIEGILINEMLAQLYTEFGSVQEVTYFIEEDSVDELNLALAAGFEIKDTYRCYKCLL